MNEENQMEIHLAYCAGCDRQVKVVVDPEVAKAGREPTAADLICLEHGTACTGQLCPIFGVPSEEMERRYGSLLSRARKGEA
ncbi:MAG: hypothetical protein JSU98_15890 [Gemmatimonadales bacterium]|jgi:hypothetical protein|nr:MAG: hypothetical protein JSU98_15890 [Gemmatimonadales bacterium]